MSERPMSRAEQLRHATKRMLGIELTEAQKAEAEAAEKAQGAVAGAEIETPVVDTPLDIPTGTAPIDRAHDENEARRAAQADLAEATRAAAALEPVAPPAAAVEPVVEDEDEKTAPPVQHPARKPRGSKKMHGSNNQTTTLHGGLEVARHEMKRGEELSEEIETLKENVDARIAAIANTMDQAALRIVDKVTYEYDKEKKSIVAAGTELQFKEQLRNTRKAAREFADIVKVLPQEIANFVTQLNDSSNAYDVILDQSGTISRTPFAQVEPWDPNRAEREVDPAGFTLQGRPKIVETPGMEHGFKEAERGGDIASAMVEAAESLKARLDREVIAILNTINMFTTRILESGVCTLTDVDIKVTEEELPKKPTKKYFSNQMKIRRELIQDLLEISKELPDQVRHLISEVRDAESEFAKILRDGPPAQTT